MNFETHVAAQLAHLIRMAKEPGWKAWAWKRAKELALADPMYADLPRLLTAAMTAPAAQSEPGSVSAYPAKPSAA